MNDLKVGTVFKLHRPYSNPNFNYNPKERYFIYLGKSSIVDGDEIIAILSSPTTQTKYYESYGDRVKRIGPEADTGKCEIIRVKAKMNVYQKEYK